MQPASGHDRSFTVPSPLIRSSSSLADQRSSLQPSPRSKQYVGSSYVPVDPTSEQRNRHTFSSFNFPNSSGALDKTSRQLPLVLTKPPLDPLRRTFLPKPREPPFGSGQLIPATEILSPASINDTPRSSGELYSMSNNSTDTLASDYLIQEDNRLTYRSPNSRQGSCLAPSKAAKPELLMMGYTQIMGSFTLDGSLVNQSAFEGARRMGIVGGQGGGGVVRTESTKRDSGLLGTLGWGKIGESLGGLLGNNEMSSIKEAKGSSKARAIPILSTPQSILFVDLRLGPGESKSYTYRHPLPKGIPPTHKGRAMKTSYSLVIGTQRAAKASQQHQIEHVDIPFKVLTSVNGRILDSSCLMGV